jgi:hypothetical protein
MVSLILPMPRFEPALLESLAACVPAVADGLIRDALVATPTRSGELDAIIDAAGCHLVSAEGDTWALLQAASAQARSDWFLVLSPGLVPSGGWIAQSEDFLSDHDPEMIGLARLQPRGSLIKRLGYFGENRLNPLRSRPVLHGALIHRRGLHTPEKTRRTRLDWILTDRRRGV